jgi:hypothetical protein
MGNARDAMWNTTGKHAMSAWRERQAERQMLWALEEGARASTQKPTPRSYVSGLETPNIPDAWRET